MILESLTLPHTLIVGAAITFAILLIGAVFNAMR